MIKKIKDYIKNNNLILRWAIISFLVVFLVVFFAYVNNDSKSGVYPEEEFGSLKELEKSMNPYANIYTIKQYKVDNNKYTKKIEQFGFGFISAEDNLGGSIVVMVSLGSPAEKAGIKKGDIIKKVDGIEILKNNQLDRLIDSKNGTQLEIKRGDHIFDLYITKGTFMSEEGFNIGSPIKIPLSKDISNLNVLEQVDYGLGRLREGLIEYSVEGISFFGAMLISFLWTITILPVLILGILFYKLFSKIRHKIFKILFIILFSMSGIIFLFASSKFIDEMVRNSIDIDGGFIDMSILIYPFFVIIVSVFLTIGYTISLFIYNKHLSRM